MNYPYRYIIPAVVPSFPRQGGAAYRGKRGATEWPSIGVGIRGFEGRSRCGTLVRGKLGRMAAFEFQ